ncbi:enoyl-CoA hydratase [Emcibacter nanhaiensis]|uniref:Enoyl-CoA hydratase n=1 Tax=Emcibacter nanhaiensis TaxID=1505037 RepID=A0A501PGX6_9PROT|nr:enoyl-CoA hydratase [Emcibacter nanhaiensis]TPD59455.1 enoyl-CoA hydratase [Emcibacter nanhaiensis]
MDDYILNERDGSLLVLTFNRPDKKNAITQDMYTALSDGLVEAAEDASVRAVVILANGDAFTSGNDLKDFAAGLRHAEKTPVFRFLKTISHFEKPIMVGVNGLAVGIGTTLLLHSDLVYASPEATFSTPFANLALVPEAASSLLLPRLIGMAKATEMLMMGQVLDAEEAERAGLVARILPGNNFREQVLERARELAGKAPTALMETKRLLRKNNQEIQDRMDEEGLLFAERLKTPEFMEVATAFFEKRPPDFSKF